MECFFANRSELDTKVIVENCFYYICLHFCFFAINVKSICLNTMLREKKTFERETMNITVSNKHENGQVCLRNTFKTSPLCSSRCNLRVSRGSMGLCTSPTIAQKASELEMSSVATHQSGSSSLLSSLHKHEPKGS